MSHVNIIRAWKDEAYRLSLSEAERARLPENPAGALALTEAEAEAAVGGYVAYPPNPVRGLVAFTPPTLGRPALWF